MLFLTKRIYLYPVLQSKRTEEVLKNSGSPIVVAVSVMFTTFLSSKNKANDQKKLKKMVEELANKYGKTEDEIFYAYDQWVFLLLKQESFFYFLFVENNIN